MSVAAPKPGCISMANSAVCTGGFGNYFVYSDPAMRNPPFANLTSFDSYMQNWIDDSKSFKTQMQVFYGCGGYSGQGLRYHLTAYCAVWAFLGSQKCGNNNSGGNVFTPVCQSSVADFLSSFDSLTQNTTICNATATLTADVANNRSDYRNLFYNLAAQNTFDTSNNCLVSIDIDKSSFCGFKTMTEGQNWCQTNYDLCCNLNGLTQIIPPPTTTPTSSVAPTASATPTPSSSSSNGIPTLTIIIAGSAVLVLLTVLLIGIWCKKHRSDKRAADLDMDFRDMGSHEMQSSISPQSRKSASIVNPNFNHPVKKTYAASSASFEKDSYYKNIVNPQPSPSLGKRLHADEKKFWTIINFKAMKSDELSLIIGDVVTVQQRYDDGWCFGQNTLTGSKGFFPLECLAEAPNMKHSRTSVQGFNKRVSSIYGVQDIDNSFIVQYDYNANMPDEIHLRASDRVIVYQEYDDGWAYGMSLSSKQEGLFPLDILANYTTKRGNSTLRRQRDSSRYNDVKKPAITSSKMNSLNATKVLYAFNPVQKDELMLKTGHLVVIKQKFDDGWAMGENISTGLTGMFPLDCVAVELVAAQRQNRTSSYYESQIDENENRNNTLYSIYSTGMGAEYDDQRLNKDNESEKVLYEFTPQRSDEVGLRAGDKVVVNQKFDDGWCYGLSLATGQEGYFPLDCLASFSKGQKKLNARTSSIFDEKESSNPQHSGAISQNVGERVIYDYLPAKSDEVELKTGQFVQVSQSFDDGWAYGTNLNTNKQGYFPLDCLESFGDQSGNAPPASKQRTSSMFESEMDVLDLNVADIAKIGSDEVVDDFHPEKSDECPLARGDRVMVQKSFDDGWCYGANLSTGREGYFPYDCLKSYGGKKPATTKKLERVSSIYDSPPASNTPVPPVTTSQVGASINSTLAVSNSGGNEGGREVVYDFLPERDDELALYIGQLVVILHMFDDGWSYGKNLSTGREGNFPTECVLAKRTSAKIPTLSKRASSLYGDKQKNYYGNSVYTDGGNNPKQTSVYSVGGRAETHVSETRRDVIYAFQPEQSDEVALYPGDKVVVQTVYDDGWALVSNMSSGVEGLCPLDCLSGFAKDGGSLKKQRVSSMYTSNSVYSDRNSYYDSAPQNPGGRK